MCAASRLPTEIGPTEFEPTRFHKVVVLAHAARVPQAQGDREKTEDRGGDETYTLQETHTGFAWIGLYRPTAAELASVAVEFDLHLFAGPDFLITIRHAESPDMGSVRRRLEQHPELLALGSEAVLYAVLGRMVDEYEPVVSGIENDIDEIEDDLFGDSDDDALSRRIYELSGELIRFSRATHPLVSIIEWLQRGHDVYHVDIELQRRLRDVQDHAIRVTERIDGFRTTLDKALAVHSALVARRQTEVNLQQNEQVKKISSWAAIIFAPTLIGTVYGMNFDIMTELPASAQVNISSATRSRYPSTRSGLRMDSSLARTRCAIDIPLASQLASSCAEVAKGWGRRRPGFRRCPGWPVTRPGVPADPRSSGP